MNQMKKKKLDKNGEGQQAYISFLYKKKKIKKMTKNEILQILQI